jgi:hypothetical protein
MEEPNKTRCLGIGLLLARLLLLGSMVCAGEDTWRKLNEIMLSEELTDGGFTAIERECLSLAAQTTSPSDRGEIYAELALLYADHGEETLTPMYAEKTAEYAKKALQHPIRVVTAWELYLRWGHTVRENYSPLSRHSIARARRLAVTIYLKGLALVLRNEIEERKEGSGQSQNGPDPYAVSEDLRKSPSFQQAVRRRAEQFIRSVVQEYAQSEGGTSELKTLCDRYIPVKHVREKIAKGVTAERDRLSRFYAKLVERGYQITKRSHLGDDPHIIVDAPEPKPFQQALGRPARGASYWLHAVLPIAGAVFGFLLGVFWARRCNGPRSSTVGRDE